MGRREGSSNEKMSTWILSGKKRLREVRREFRREVEGQRKQKMNK